MSEEPVLDASLLIYVFWRMMRGEARVQMSKQSRNYGSSSEQTVVINVPVPVFQEWVAWRGAIYGIDEQALHRAYEEAEAMMIDFADQFRGVIAAREAKR